MNKALLTFSLFASLAASTAVAGERYAHKCSNDQTKPTEYVGANTKAEALKEFKKFYPEAAPYDSFHALYKNKVAWVFLINHEGKPTACALRGSRGPM